MSLCTPLTHMGSGGVQPHSFLTTALDGSERSASRLDRFRSGEIVAGTFQ